MVWLGQMYAQPNQLLNNSARMHMTKWIERPSISLLNLSVSEWNAELRRLISSINIHMWKCTRFLAWWNEGNFPQKLYPPRGIVIWWSELMIDWVKLIPNFLYLQCVWKPPKFPQPSTSYSTDSTLFSAVLFLKYNIYNEQSRPCHKFSGKSVRPTT